MIADNGQHTPSSLEEAECLLNLAHAKRDSQRAAKRLADTRLRESKLHTKLHLLQAKQATRVWVDAEVDVGRMSLAIETSGLLVFPSPAESLQIYGSHGTLFILPSLPNLICLYVDGAGSSGSCKSLTAQLD